MELVALWRQFWSRPPEREDSEGPGRFGRPKASGQPPLELRALSVVLLNDTLAFHSLKALAGAAPFAAPGLSAALARARQLQERQNRQLLQAAGRNDLELATQAVHLGADPNGTNDQGWTALHLAASKGHAAVARYLLHIGAEPGVQCQVPVWPKEVFTPLRIAIRYGKARVQMLQQSQQDRFMASVCRKTGMRLEILAVLLEKPCEEDLQEGHVELARALLAAAAAI